MHAPSLPLKFSLFFRCHKVSFWERIGAPVVIGRKRIVALNAHNIAPTARHFTLGAVAKHTTRAACLVKPFNVKFVSGPCWLLALVKWIAVSHLGTVKIKIWYSWQIARLRTFRRGCAGPVSGSPWLHGPEFKCHHCASIHHEIKRYPFRAMRPRRKATIYTRTGDQGETILFSGQRLSKSHFIFDALGTIDELNAKLGTIRVHLLDDEYSEMEEMVRAIQSRLIDIGSSVATPRNATQSRTKLERTSFEQEHVDRLEEYIDHLDTRLPRLTTFILPSGGTRAAAFHEARTVARRAEREVIRIGTDFEQEATVLRYLNRLSDLLFMCARFCSRQDGFVEHVYCKPKKCAPKTDEVTVEI